MNTRGGNDRTNDLTNGRTNGRANGRADDRAQEILATLMGRPLVADPFPLYHELRTIDPVHREPNGMWYLTRFTDCDRVYRSPSFGHGDGQTHHAGEAGRRATLLSLMFSFDDPPTHTRKRGLVAEPFSASEAVAYRARTQQLVDQLLDPIDRGAEVDLDEVLSARLPVLVTCELLGIPDTDRDRCVGWVEMLTSSNQPVLTGDGAAKILADADEAADRAADYFTWLLRERVERPRDDIMSKLAPLALGGDRYTPDEIAATLILLMAAGFETTRYTITGGLLALAEHPDQWALARRQVRDRGGLSNDATEELLRHQGPIHGAIARTSRLDEDFGAAVVPAGEAVVAMVAAANRDPEVFDRPDEFDITRTGRRPLSFGAGLHFCLGAFLARDEIRLAVGGVLQRFDRLEVLEPTATKGSFNVRGPKGLRVRVH
jgi:cytochrome P450